MQLCYIMGWKQLLSDFFPRIERNLDYVRLYYSKAHIQKTNPGPKVWILRIAGASTEHLFSFNVCFKKKQMVGWYLAIMSLDSILMPRIGFLNMGLIIVGSATNQPRSLSCNQLETSILALSGCSSPISVEP